MKRLVLIDGNALIHRAYHATPPLTTSKGELVNAIYGFTLLLLKGIADLKPEYLAVAWDMKGKTFRHTAYAEYKGKRGPSDEALSNQYDRVHQVTGAFSIPEFKLPGFEADDLVGALARQAVKKDKSLEVVIITGDRDIMQLIDQKTKVLMPRKTLQDVGLYGREEFLARYGFEPANLVDYKALAGDASDNIPGVPGIGEVSATKLIQQYTTLENVYKHLEELPERQRKLLEEGRASAKQSKSLATIETQIPIKLDLPACQVHQFDHKRVVALFEELEFKSLISRIPGITGGKSIKGIKGIKPLDTRDTSKPHDTSNLTMELDAQVEQVLQRMSQHGVLIDLKFLKKFGASLKQQLIKIEKEIYATVGHQFNLNSPKQLAPVLFDELKLPVVRKTKTGRSTDEETLNELSSSHPVVPLILRYRQLFKLISTYIDALPRFVKEDGRVHSTFNVEGAASGRLSSVDPNLMNIPVRGTLGGEMRKAFVAPKGKVLLGVDYSQIDLRVMAHLSNDLGLTKAFREGLDIHLLTASKIFKVPLDKVTREQRGVGKTMNFATLYGQGPHALSRTLGVEYRVAQGYIAEYFAQFPKVKQWMQTTLERAYKNGYVQTIWGRRRYMPELLAQSRMMRSHGERAAVNHPVQGTSSDMIKKAMVEIQKQLSIFNVQCSMVLQIHDELLFECDPKSVIEVGKMVKAKMEGAIELSVPVVAEAKSGPNWGEMQPLSL